jgi:hypothetical protein
LLGLLLIANCGQATAAEQSDFRLWPFGGDRVDDDMDLTGNSLGPATPAATTPGAFGSIPSHVPDALPERHWMFQSPLTRVSWPRIHMPEVSFPRPNLSRPPLWSRKSHVDDSRNAWTQKNPDPDRPSPLKSVQQGAQRVGQSTRSAWRRTVDVLTPGDSTTASDPRVAARPQQPPLWKRMIGRSQPQVQGPRTVNEMLSQERLDF